VGSTAPIPQRVEEVMAQMSESQELSLVEGISGTYEWNLPAIPALCIPAFAMEDGPEGVGDGMTGVTELPAAVDAAATWDPTLEQQYGAVVGSEDAGKGANVDLGPTINIVRDPRWGRAFEALSEDPYLAGQMGAAYIKGVQSQGVMAMVKHWAVYNNETNRNTSADDDVVQERAMQEIYMPAFQAAVNAGVDSAMCAYSWPNDVPACQNGYLYGVLNNEFGFQGFVASDYDAMQSTNASIEAGDDMDMPGSDGYYGSALADAIPSQVPQAYLDDAIERILTALFEQGLMGTTSSGNSGNTVTTSAHVTTALQTAEEGTVLLKNSPKLLPLNASTVGSIAVIGTDADSGVSNQCIYGSPDTVIPYSGGGSACVDPGATPISPLAGIQAAVGSGVTVTYNNGSSDSSAESAAAAAKVAIVVVGYQETEADDITSIDLGSADDTLISDVASANPNTVVVLDTGSAVTMPWLSSVPAVLEQWYPGQEDGTALANVLFGTFDPSGHLPVTFPTSLSQVPATTAAEFPGANGEVQYNEGIDVGYRWYQSKGLTPLFPFGFGLSYTTFSFSNLSITGFNSSGVATVSATVTNTGSVAGADVAQIYIGDPSSTGEPPWQLKGFDRVSLNPGASTTVTFSVPVHDLTYWGGSGATSYPNSWSGTDGGGWEAPAGSYAIGVGDSSANLPLTGALTLSTAVGPDTVTVNNPGNQTSAVGATVSLNISASDSVSGQALSYSASALPGGLSISPTTGAITGTALHAGTDTVTVTATDGEAWEGSTSFTWTVQTEVLPGTNCSAAVTGTQLNESGFVASTNSDSAGADLPQNAITNAVNGTDTTRFSTDEDQVPGLTYEVNMGSAQTFGEIDMAVPTSATDYARGYSVNVSSNGSTWTTVATCTGTGTPEIVTFPSVTDQYLEVVLTASNASEWWSINQFFVYNTGSAPTTTTTSAGEAPYGGTAAAVPGTVYAANYDTGGQGVAYNVTSTNGTANSYRSDGIDLEASADTVDNTGSGVDDLGWTATGQWFRYTVNVATAGTYTVSLRLSSLDGATDGLHIANTAGTNLSGDINVPDTGAWQTWATVTASVTLPAGTQTLVVDQDNGGWNLHFMSFAVASSGEAPYGGTAAAVPGTVYAANYDTGGQGVAYNVTSTNGTANSYRSDGVDLEATADTVDNTGSGVDDLGWTATGQWFRYTVNVATAGTYTVSLRLASPDAVTDGLHIANTGGTNLSGDINVPATGGYQDWTTVTATVTLPAGTQTLVVDQDNPGWNIHFLSFASSGGATTTTTSPPGTIGAGDYEIVNENSGMCEEPAAGGTANGTAVEQEPCASPATAAQEWEFTSVGTGIYEVLNVNGAAGGEAWNVTGGVGATGNGVGIQIWNYGAGATNEQFKATAVTGGYYNFVAQNSALCVDTPGASVTAGVQLDQYTCNGTGAQEFKLVLE
jgi:beta-glucosidase